MRVVLIGCTNGLDDLLSVPDGDVLICTGDFSTATGSRFDLDKFNALLGRLPHRHKFVVFGDRDGWCDANETEAISRLYNAKVLMDETVEVDGVKIYGTPWFPASLGGDLTFRHAFCDSDEFVAQRWKDIPVGLDILVTHCPDSYAALADVVKKVRPKIHAFSHGDGRQHYARIKSVSVTQYDRCNKQVGTPVIIDI